MKTNYKQSALIAVVLTVVSALIAKLWRANQRAENHRVQVSSLLAQNGAMGAEKIKLTTELDAANERIIELERENGEYEGRNDELENQAYEYRRRINLRNWLIAFLIILAFVLSNVASLIYGGVIETPASRNAFTAEIRVDESGIQFDCGNAFHFELDPVGILPEADLSNFSMANDADLPVNIIDMHVAEWPAYSGIELVQERDEFHNVPGILEVGGYRLQFWQNSVINIDTDEAPVLGERYYIHDFSTVGSDNIGQVYLTQNPDLAMEP